MSLDRNVNRVNIVGSEGESEQALLLFMAQQAAQQQQAQQAQQEVQQGPAPELTHPNLNRAVINRGARRRPSIKSCFALDNSAILARAVIPKHTRRNPSRFHTSTR